MRLMEVKMMSKQIMSSIDCLKEYRENKEKYLPLVDHETKYFPDRNEFDDVNIGWDMGFIGERPYFLECWAAEGITMITIYLSTIGLERASEYDLERILIDNKIYEPLDDYESPECPRFHDSNDNEFFSINVVVGFEEEPAKIKGGRLASFSVLNELNGLTGEEDE